MRREKKLLDYAVKIHTSSVIPIKLRGWNCVTLTDKSCVELKKYLKETEDEKWLMNFIMIVSEEEKKFHFYV